MDNGELSKPEWGARFALAAAVVAVELAVLDLLGQLETAGVDRRLLAIGRTQCELGFMAVHRSIGPLTQTRPTAEKPTDETAWVLERADSSPADPLYYSPYAHGEQWSRDHGEALRFAREHDAARLGAALGIAVRVCEHQWS